MCYYCWEKYYKKADIKTDKVIKAIYLIRDVYRHNQLGGNLHAALDDWNLEDFDDDFVIHNDKASAEQLAAERACHAHMQAMTIEERASALARYEGFTPKTIEYEPTK